VKEPKNISEEKCNMKESKKRMSYAKTPKNSKAKRAKESVPKRIPDIRS
jgi:hypothetical protein